MTTEEAHHGAVHVITHMPLEGAAGAASQVSPSSSSRLLLGAGVSGD